MSPPAKSGAAAVIDEYLDYANAVVKVQLPPYFYAAWVACRLVPVNKVSPRDLPPGVSPASRPLNIGGAERRAITRAYFDEGLKTTYNSILGPVQNGVGVKGGISVTAIGVQAALDANPDFGIIQGDIKNGYNEVARESVLNAIRSAGTLGDTLAFSHALLEPEAYVGMGSGTGLFTAPFKMVEGVHQGAVESGWYFSITCNRAFQNLREYLAPSGGGVQAIIDDNYSFGRPDVIFEANKAFAADLAIVGLELQSAKSQCYIRPGLRDSNWDALRGDIPNGLLRDSSGEAVLIDGTPTVPGITVCNVPVASRRLSRATLPNASRESPTATSA
ncbi:hypothetical protein THAOC_07730, partial [Thalassiosira oceanica]